MATIELDIIKQRCEKLTPAEKLELINYLAASLAPEEIERSAKLLDFDRTKAASRSTPTDEFPKVA